MFSFRKPTGILKLFKSKPCLILSVLPPVYPKQNLAFNERYLDLKENVYEKMSEKNIKYILSLIFLYIFH